MSWPVQTPSNLTVGLNTLISGEDQVRNAMRTINGAQVYGVVIPLPSAAGSGTMPRSDVICGGGVGGSNDYIDNITVMVNSNTNGAVYIRDGAVADLTSGTTGTNPAGTTTLAVTASANVTWTTNQFAGYIVRVTYTPTSGASTTVKRRIVSHASVAASTAITFIVTHNLPAGATITSWGLEPLSSWELFPYNTPVGVYNIRFGKASAYGAWKLSVDLGVQVEYVGAFT